MTSQQRYGWTILILFVGVLGLFGYRVLSEGGRVRDAERSETAPKVLVTDPIRGDPAAAITVIEYGDFQCPLCRSEQPALKVFVAKYKNSIRLVWKDFPITALHPESLQAAEAARCAAEQGKFWEMHDALFTNQERLGDALYAELAGGLGLDTAQFQDCRATDRTVSLITASAESGSLARVDGTPYYFFGTDRVNQLPNAEQLDQFVHNNTLP